jgi:hypothetical protein
MKATKSRPAAARTPIATLELAVEGERPTQHAHRVEALLRGAPGIRKVEAHTDEERVLVKYNPTETNPAAIHEHLIDHGYHAAARAD